MTQRGEQGSGWTPDKDVEAEVKTESAPNLEALRARIDEIDRRIVELLNERARASLTIGGLKASGAGAGAVYVPDREIIVYSNILSVNTGPLSDAALKAVYDQIIEESRRLQARDQGRGS